MASGHPEQAVGGGLIRQVVTGMIGSALLQLGVAAAPTIGRVARPLAVSATAQGILLYRRLQTMTEEAQLIATDILAEAQQQVGDSPESSASESGDDGHRH